MYVLVSKLLILFSFKILKSAYFGPFYEDSINFFWQNDEATCILDN